MNIKEINMAELTEQQIEHLKKLNAQAVKEVMTDKGNIAFLNSSIKKFIDDLKEQNKDCEPAAYMMSGAIMGYTLCLYNKEKELKNAYFLRDDEQKRNRVLEQKLKEEISKNQILEAVVLEINNVIDGKAGLHTDTARIARIMSVLNRNKGGEGDGSST